MRGVFLPGVWCAEKNTTAVIQTSLLYRCFPICMESVPFTAAQQLAGLCYWRFIFLRLHCREGHNINDVTIFPWIFLWITGPRVLILSPCVWASLVCVLGVGALQVERLIFCGVGKSTCHLVGGVLQHRSSLPSAKISSS